MDMHDLANVQVQPHFAKYVLILNIVLPGTGTILAGFNNANNMLDVELAKRNKWEVVANNIIVGLLQLILTPFFLIGFAWSLILGLEIWSQSRKASANEDSESKFLSYLKMLLLVSLVIFLLVIVIVYLTEVS